MEHFSGGSDGSCKGLTFVNFESCHWSVVKSDLFFSFLSTVIVDMTLALKYIKVSYIQDLKTVLVSDLHCLVYN